MSAICLPKLINQMDGFFGCNVTVKNFLGEEHEFSFKKKTLFDLIKEVFSGADAVKKNLDVTVQALKAISTHLDKQFEGQLNTLVKKYESGKFDVDFKEVRSVLRNSFLRDSIKFSPVVYSKNASVDGSLLGQTKFQASKTSETSNFVSIKPLASTPAIYQSTREEEFEQFTARWTIVSNADTVIDLSKKTSTSEKTEVMGIDCPSAQDFKSIYQKRLDESISKKTFKIEISYDPDGTVSDENLAVLAETIIEKEKEKGNRFCVFFTKEDDEEFRLISERVEQAFVEYAAEHGKFRSQELKKDSAELQSELVQLHSQYQMAPLNTLNTSRW